MVQHWPATQEYVVRFVYPYSDVWISTVPGLKLAYISTLSEIILPISTQTYISLPVCKVG